MHTKTVVKFSATTMLLALLPGCFSSKEEKQPMPEKQDVVAQASQQSTSGATDSSEVLLSIDGKPVVTARILEQYKNDIIEAQPEQGREQYRQLMELIPGALKSVFDNLANEEMIAAWIEKEGVDKTAAYQKEVQENIDRFIKFARRTQNVKEFQKSVDIAVSAADVRKYYEENKNKIPDLIASPGGVAAKAVFFEKEADAQDFLKKASVAKADFDAIARDAKLVVKDLGAVNDQSFEVEAPIRTKLLAMSTFPAVELIKVGEGSFAVVKALSKEEQKYVPFDQVQGALENWLKQQKSGEALLKRLEELKKQYKVTVNDDFFARMAKAKGGVPSAEADQEVTQPQPSAARGA